MRVLIITANLNPHSGWGRYSRAVIDQLRAQGCDVSVCAEGRNVSEYEVVSLRPLSVLGFFKNLLKARAAARNVNVVHALDGWPYGVYGYFAALGTRKKLFVNGIGTYSVAPLYQRTKGWLLRKAYGRAERIFCISDYTRNELAQAGIPIKKLLTVLQGAVRLPEISEEEKASYVEKYTTGKRHPLILTVGAIKERKGQFDTLKAVELLKKQYPDILYVALGSSKSVYAARMREYADKHGLQNNFLIISDADDRALSFFYAACNVFALNSTTDRQHHHFEGFGLVIVEAYQFGTPAVGSRDCGIESAIKDGATGFLSRQRDPEDIAAKISAALDRHDLLSRHVREEYPRFDWSATAACYIEFYRSSSL